MTTITSTNITSRSGAPSAKSRSIVKRMFPRGVTSADLSTAPEIDTWPSTGQGIVVKQARFQIDQGLQNLMRTHNDNVPTHARMQVFRDALHLVMTKFSSLSELLHDVIGEIDGYMGSSQRLEKRLEECENLLQESESRFTVRLEAVRAAHHHELASVQSAVVKREGETGQIQLMTDLLHSRNESMQAQIENYAEKGKERDALLAQQLKELSIKREMVRVLQEKNAEIIAENKFLRQICDHNADLLEETKELKGLLCSVRDGYEEQLRTQQGKIDDLRRERSRFDIHLKHLKRTIKSQAEEIAQLRGYAGEVESLSGACRVQRDQLVTTHTPRPDSNRPMALLSAAGSALANQRKVSTAEVLSAMAMHLETTKDALNKMQFKYQVATKAVDFLTGDDFEQFANSEMPVRSKCVVAFGTHKLVPPALRYVGLVPTRLMSVDEVALLIKDFRKDRVGLSVKATNALVPLADAIANYFQQRFPGPGQATEMAYSFYLALPTLCGICELNLFHRILMLDMPEKLLDEVNEFLDSMVAALRAIIGKLGSVNDKKKRVLRRRVFFDTLHKLMPDLPDGDFLRLKAVVQAEIERHIELNGGKGSKDEVPIEAMLEEPEGGGVHPPFAAALFRQYLAEYEAYRVSLESKFVEIAGEDEVVTAIDLADAITVFDEEKTDEEVTAFLQKVLDPSTTNDEIARVAPGPNPTVPPSGHVGRQPEGLQFNVYSVIRKAKSFYWTRGVSKAYVEDKSVPQDPRKAEDIGRKSITTMRANNMKRQKKSDRMELEKSLSNA